VHAQADRERALAVMLGRLAERGGVTLPKSLHCGTVVVLERIVLEQALSLTVKAASPPETPPRGRSTPLRMIKGGAA
jgi:hypothetical protein